MGDVNLERVRFGRRGTNPPAAATVTERNTEAELRIFFGRNSEPFLKHYQRLQTLGRTAARSWSWAFFLTGFIWAFYRRLYAVGLLLFLMPLILMLLHIKSHYALLGTSISLAMYAKSIYVQHGLRQIKHADKRQLTGNTRTAFLARRGGTSVTAAIAASIVFALQISISTVFALNQHILHHKFPATSSMPKLRDGYPFMRHQFSTIVHSQSHASTTIIADARSAAEAQHNALNLCQHGAGEPQDCTVMLNFEDTCGAAARGKNGAWGSGWGPNPDPAQKWALDSCKRFGGIECKVEQVQCTANAQQVKADQPGG